MTTGGWWKGSSTGVDTGVDTGVAWRDLPRSEFGPGQTVWKRHRRYSGDGTWDAALQLLLRRSGGAAEVCDESSRTQFKPFDPLDSRRFPIEAGVGERRQLSHVG